MIAEDVPLQAGPLSATLSSADLLDIRWGGLDVCSRIQVTVRDPDWGTVLPVLRHRRVDRTRDAFTVSLEAVHDAGPIGFGWTGTIEGHADGRLRFVVEGAAERAFSYRRIGICALHPWRSYAGASYRAISTAGAATGVFPREIAPQPLRDGLYHPMIEAFSELRVRFPDGPAAAFVFEGEPIELEDQRNWTDASFKSYPTPLADPELRRIEVGNRIAQRLDLRLAGPAPPSRRRDDAVVTLGLGGPSGRRMPAIGLVGTAHVGNGPAHVRVDVASGRDGAAALHRTDVTDVPLELAISLGDENVVELETLRAQLRGRRLARVMIHRADGATIESGLVRTARAGLGVAIAGDVPVVGGTSSYFSELNRAAPDPDGLDAVAFGISPQLHAVDERSIMETLEIQGQVARRASELAGGLPIVVSPISLEGHDGSAFADAWSVGSVAAIAGTGVATSATFAQPTDHLVALMPFRGAELLEVEVSEPGRMAVLAVAAAEGARLLMAANLTGRSQRWAVDGRVQAVLEPYEVRVVDDVEEVGAAATASS